MDVLQTVCRKAATSSARPSLLALSMLRTPAASSRSLFSTSRLLLADKPPRPPPETSSSEGIMRLRKNLQRSADARRSSGNSLFGRSMNHFSELITKDADQSLKPFSPDEFAQMHLKRTEMEANLRLRPVTGRTVNVRFGAVPTAFQELQRKVGANSIRADEMRQRFHERPALRRKRKLRERWRARFKEGMHSAISRTLALRAQGW